MNEEGIIRPMFAPSRVRALISMLSELDDYSLYIAETMIKGLSGPPKPAPHRGAYTSWATDCGIIQGPDEPGKDPSRMPAITRGSLHIYKPKRKESPKSIEELQEAGYTVIGYRTYLKKSDGADLISGLLRKDRRFYSYCWIKDDILEKGNPIRPMKVFEAHSNYHHYRKKDRLLSIDQAFPNYQAYRWNQEGKLVSPDIEALPPEAGEL